MSTSATRPPGRPRSAKTDATIVEATLELMREQGPRAVNVAAIAARTALARTTIYRRYRDREELLEVALRAVTARGAPESDLPVEEKLMWVVTRAEEVLAHGIGLGGVASVLAGEDPDMDKALRRALDVGLEPVREQITSDIAHGRLATSVDADILLDLILGSYLAATLRRGEPQADWKKRTVALLGVLLRRPDEGRV